MKEKFTCVMRAKLLHLKVKHPDHLSSFCINGQLYPFENFKPSLMYNIYIYVGLPTNQ